MNFKAVLALPKTARSAQTHETISFIWIVWSTLYVYLWKFAQNIHPKYSFIWPYSFNWYLRVRSFFNTKKTVTNETLHCSTCQIADFPFDCCHFLVFFVNNYFLSWTTWWQYLSVSRALCTSKMTHDTLLCECSI